MRGRVCVIKDVMTYIPMMPESRTSVNLLHDTRAILSSPTEEGRTLWSGLLWNLLQHDCFRSCQLADEYLGHAGWLFHSPSGQRC